MPVNQAFDFIIVGAGSAGCVLANELSQDPNNSVLIIEAGPADNKLLIHMPGGVYSVYKDPSINWNYESEPEPALANRRIPLPRGRVLGGSSSINSMVYMRGHPQDYDNWADRYNLPIWSFDQCLPYFKKCESSDRGASDWRGAEGRLGVSQAKLENPLFDAFLEAGEQSGQGITEDPNGRKPEGLSRLDSTTRNGRRSSAATAHLKPVLTRPNLHLLTRALAHRILIEHGRATGIVLEHRGQVLTVHANREVLICCGAINSPQLLMISGIGPADHLGEHGIKPLHHLAGVGENLQDHLSVSVIHAARQPVTYHNVGNPVRKLLMGMQWLLTRRGFVASNIWEAGGHIRGHADVPYPNLQYHFSPIHARYDGLKIKLLNGYTSQLDQLRPRSRGSVRLRSGDPKDRPAVNFNYLQDPFDTRELVEAVRRMRELNAQNAFSPFRGAELEPGPDVTRDAEIEAFVRNTATTDYHPCGTCRMGRDDMAVLDQEMRVRGIDHLRVVDASAMPDIISGNLNAPVQMMALKIADLVLGRNPLPPLKAFFEFGQDRFGTSQPADFQIVST